MFKYLSAGTPRLIAFLLMTSMVWVGCGEDSVTGVNPDSDGTLQLVEDPFTGVLNSTDGFTPADADARIDRLAQHLGLDEQQKADLAEAYAAFHATIKDLRAQHDAGDLTKEEARAAASDARDAFEAGLQIILTPEQYDLLQEMREKRDDRRRGHRNPRDRWGAWLQEIGASDTQVADIVAAMQAVRDGMLELREQLLAGEIDKEAAMAAAAELRDAFDASLQEILTPEQYEALQALRPDCSGKRGGR